jgi:hypothetical protein
MQNEVEVNQVKYSYLIEDGFKRIINRKLSFPKKIIRNCPKVLIDASLIIDVLLERNSIYLDDAIEIMDYVIANQQLES